MNITDKDLERGYAECRCGGVHLLQAGYEVKLHFCTECHEMVANRDEFFMNVGVEVLGK